MLRSLIVLTAALALGACGDTADGSATDATSDAAVSNGVAGPTSTVVLDYEGRLEDGTVFDSNEKYRADLPNMVPGFRDGIVGMSAGDTKTFDVPPELGYGATGGGPIPPNATLTFEVTVHEVL